MEETLIFIDGGFLSKLSKYFGNGKYINFDLIKFAKGISKKYDLICSHIFYYTAPPFQANPPNKLENLKREKYDRFISKLSKKAVITIREGRCQRTKKFDGKFEYSQKGVDTLMTMDLVSIPINYPNIKNVIVIACDSDFIPILKNLRALNIKIILATYFDNKRNSIFSTSNELIKSVSEYLKLNKTDFEGFEIER